MLNYMLAFMQTLSYESLEDKELLRMKVSKPEPAGYGTERLRNSPN